MSANRLFLVCKHCESLERALLLAERADGNSQYTAASVKRADDWYARHQRCGIGIDNFKLAYHRPQDWDLSPPAQDTTAGAVRLAIAAGMNEGSDHNKFIHGDEQSVGDWRGNGAKPNGSGS